MIDSKKEEQLFVSPVNGTVLFASAAHGGFLECSLEVGWCFSLRQFAEIYAPIYGINKARLLQYMWGDFVFNPKTKKISTWKPTDAQSPIFVKMVLSTVWKVYKSVFKRDDEAIRSILELTKVRLTPAELKTTDNALMVKLILSRWLPLYKAVLSGCGDGV